MKKKLKSQRTRNNVSRNRRKTSRIPVSDLLRTIGSGFLKVSLFLFVLTVVSLGFVMLYNYLLTSPYMKLAHVEIHGVDQDMKDELLQISGLTSEQGLLSLKLESLKKKMEKHPWVRTATVQRRFPDTLIVQVEKEEPVMLVLLDRFFYMNRYGNLFKPVTQTEKMDLPILTGLSGNDPGKKEKLAQTIQVLNALETEKKSWSLQNLSEIHLDKKGGISLYFNNFQATIRISGNNVAGKMEKLKQVAKHLRESGKMNLVTRIDLNHVDGAIVSFKKTQVSG